MVPLHTAKVPILAEVPAGRKMFRTWAPPARWICLSLAASGSAAIWTIRDDKNIQNDLLTSNPCLLVFPSLCSG
jgi:hypothetical protein